MTPEDMARIFARSADPDDQARGAAMILRSLTDDGPDFRQGWPMNELTAERAISYLGLAATPELIARTLALAPGLSDALLNKTTGEG